MIVKVGGKCCTCTNEEHVIHVFGRLHSMHSDLRVAHVTFQQKRLAADHTVHQKVVFDEIQHLVWHVE